jgi:hypothetical protein
MTKFRAIFSGIIFFLVSIGMLIGGFFFASSTLSFKANSSSAEGVVIDLTRKYSSDGGATYAPVVAFKDTSGTEITFTTGMASNPPAYTKGEKVSVMYNPGDPQDARIDTFFQLWFPALILSVMGLIFLLASLSMIIKTVRGSAVNRNLMQTGTRVSAKVTSVQTNFFGQTMPMEVKTTTFSAFPGASSSSLPSRMISYTIVAQWLNPKDSKMYVFNSEPINYNPESLVLNKEIGVYVDLDNPQKYYVDISNLPQAGN